MRFVTLIAILAMYTIGCLAQEPDIWTWNVQGAWIRPTGTGSFPSIPGIPSPGDLRFEARSSVSAAQFAIGGDIGIPSDLRIGGRLRYSAIELQYRANERVPIANPDGPGVYVATIAHDLNARTVNLDLVPYLRYEPLRWIAVELAAPVMIPLSSRYQQRMFFSDPQNVPFLDGSIERITGQGTIPSLAVASLALQARIEGMVELSSSGSLALTPFVAYQQSITSPAPDGALSSRILSVGLGLRSSFNAAREVALVPLIPRRRERTLRDTTVELSRMVKQPQTVLMQRSTDSVVQGDIRDVTIRETYVTYYPKPPAILRASMQLAFVHIDGTVSDDARVLAQRVRATHVVQLLPLVVFDSTSTELPRRYVKLSPAEVPTWRPTLSVTDAPTHWQYSIHNIVGSRLRSSRTSCSLVVYVDSTQVGRARAEQRAQTIRRYLRETFGIDERRLPLRITQASGVLANCIGFDPVNPALAALTTTQMINDTELPNVRVVPDVVSESGILRWAVSVQTNGRTVRVISDTGALPAFIPWNMNADLQSEARQQDVDLHLEVVDRDSAWARSEPATIRLRSQAAADRSMIPIERTEYLDLTTSVPGLQLPSIDHRDAIRATPRDGTTSWYLRGLEEPELSLYQHATLWRKQERRP